MKNGNRAKIILQILRQTFGVPARATSEVEPFKTLILTIISQNTNGNNAHRAFEKLSDRFRIDAETLALAKISDVEECLKIAGLYRSKARVISQVSREISEQPSDFLKHLLALPFNKARLRLMQLPGVGPKTADVVLLFSANKPTIPVDTHVNRVSKRLGLVVDCAGYEATRATLQSLYNPRDYLAVHVLLISLGRKHCRARNPLCDKCSLSRLCPSLHLRKAF